MHSQKVQYLQWFTLTVCLSAGDNSNLPSIGLYYQQPYESILYSLYLQPAILQHDTWLLHRFSHPHTEAALEYVHVSVHTSPVSAHIKKTVPGKLGMYTD